ncbi:protein DA1-related 1-like [Syzygium oleosum]|uniref:protein DA1-related 1-like n=1 Tax=Syzygium oleosum TaxID=219896 RepID=UPI0024B9A0DB|nr:protein DA1-related 1-like [Syzygium oleosum]
MDDHALKPLEREIREFYERLGMKIHQRNIPLLLVNQQEMKKDKARCQKNTVEGEDHILVAHSRDLTIRVWKGFPRLFTGQTLAHEMMHAWLTLEGYHDLDLVVEEGLCEILAHMWLDSHIRSMSKSKMALSPGFDFQKRLAKFLQHDIESNPDTVYGDGFRKMKRATDMYGLKGTLDYIRMTGSYP